MEAAARTGLLGLRLDHNRYNFRSLNPSFLPATPSSSSSTLLQKSSFSKGLTRKNLQQSRSRGLLHVVVQASSAAGTSVQERWILVPVGDGDSRHIGFEVNMPGAFEIASSEVTVGRVPEKADMVIPVATVSGVHARIQKRGGNLLVTDLDSTNGTFIGDKRLRPGVASTLASGNVVIFGDIHLAMFRASKLENVEVASNGSPAKGGEEEEEAEESTGAGSG